MVKSVQEVEEFIKEIHRLLRESPKNLHIVVKHTVEDKTHNFMNEYNLTDEMVCDELLKLCTINYSKTEPDNDERFKEEHCWFLGQMYKVPGMKNYMEIYIKIKLRKRVLCLSFHPKEFDIRYPYL